MSDNNYILVLQDLKGKIQQARQRAILAVNSELLLAYWEIGNTILIQQKKEVNILHSLDINMLQEIHQLLHLKQNQFNLHNTELRKLMKNM